MAKNDKAEDSAKTDPVKTEPAKAEPVTPAFAAATPAKTMTAPKAFPSKAQYLGPNMSDDQGIFVSGTIFSNGIPEEYQLRALNEPAFSRLIVPFDRVAKVKLELMNADSSYSRLYKQVRDAYIAGQAKKGK